MIPKPTVSLLGSGEEVVLSNRAGRFVLMNGATGLGMAAQEITSAPLPGGGGVLLHRRMEEGAVLIPVLLGGDYEERREDRRLLELVCSGAVEIRLTHPDGSYRSRHGWFRDGLEGDGEQIYQDGETLVLSFQCPDPLWYGPQREERWELSPERTQFISEMSDGPSSLTLARTNHILSPGASHAPVVARQYLGVAFGVEAGAGRDGDGLEVTTTSGTFSVPPTVEFKSAASQSARYAAGVWVHGVGAVRVEVLCLERDGSKTVTATTTQAADGWSWVTVTEQSAAAGERSVKVTLTNEDGTFPPTGTVMRVDDRMMVVAGEALEYFDGGSANAGRSYVWAGATGASVSREYVTQSAGETMAVPFGVMRLSESTVQGARELDIDGDADAEAVLVVTGPGEDLDIVQETTGQEIRFRSPSGPVEIFEPVVIDARSQWQDIYSDSRSSGEWWQYINEDAPTELITLRPGKNRVRVQMVNAHPSSSVVLRYRETYRAGY